MQFGESGHMYTLQVYIYYYHHNLGNKYTHDLQKFPG